MKNIIIILLLSLPFTGKAQNTPDLYYKAFPSGQLLLSIDTLPKGSGSLFFIQSDSANIISGSTTCKHYITTTTLLYCPDNNCNTIRCYYCGKKL